MASEILRASSTLVLSRRYTDDSNAMWRAAVAAGWDVCRLQSLAPPADLGARDPVVYAETIVADAVAEVADLDFLEPSYDWLPSLPEAYRKRSIALRTLGEVRTLAARAFVKPVDAKIFPARVFEAGATIEADAFGDDEPVLVADPVRFSLEVRAFVKERTIAALSSYMWMGDIARNDAGEWLLDPREERQARAFLEGMLADPEVHLPPAVVLDVGIADGLGWVVVEANACWAAGICGCDPSAVLSVVRRANVRASTVTPAERRWSRAAHLGTVREWPQGRSQ